MSDDWLDLGAVQQDPPPTAGLPAVVEIPADYPSRIALIERCWTQLSTKQRIFLEALRDNRLAVNKTARALGYASHRSHTTWMHDPNYATVVRIWQGNVAQDALDRDRLLARQDDIVETLLTPKPVLYMGAPTGIEEVEAGAAARANETLMKASGLLKDKELEVNIGLVGPSFTIAVMQPDGQIIDATPQGVTIDLPGPAEEDWLGA